MLKQIWNENRVNNKKVKVLAVDDEYIQNHSSFIKLFFPLLIGIF